jgi:hypothetical protein
MRGKLFHRRAEFRRARTGEFTATDHVYQKDNFADTDKDGKLGWSSLRRRRFRQRRESADADDQPSTAAPQIAVTIESAQSALSNVLANAGCSLHRDAVDARLIDAVKSFGTRGKIIHDEAEVGGL